MIVLAQDQTLTFDDDTVFQEVDSHRCWTSLVLILFIIPFLSDLELTVVLFLIANHNCQDFTSHIEIRITLGKIIL